MQELAGHTSLAMTQRYIEGDSEVKRKLVALLYGGCFRACRVEKSTLVHAPATRASAGSLCQGGVAGRLDEQRCLRTRLLLPDIH